MPTAEFDSFLTVNFKNKTAQIRALGNWFYQTVRSSERFSGITLGRITDELKRPRLVIYLAESASLPSDGINTPDIETPLRELTLALLPQTFLDLYLTRANGKTLAEVVLKDMQTRYSTRSHHPKPRLLYEENFSDSLAVVQNGE